MIKIAKPITFAALLEKCRRIEIPLIQRDYAQGRNSEKDVRDEFLKALQGALSLPTNDPTLPLNLDFVYGSMEGQDKKCFLPLDGQQRLTTLFLLHWYFAWCDEALADFKSLVWDGHHARFTYGVRPSSTEFFDEIICHQPACSPDKLPSVSIHLQDQPWFFLHWRLDPTIQSTLIMLDAIHARFKNKKGLYSRLVNLQQPVITFHLLPLEHFGLTDDLYIKMNARGKPLTAFETFKARFEELLKELFPTETRRIGTEELNIPKFFAVRIDTQWTDFFWAYKDNNTTVFDNALMNLLYALIRISLSHAHPRFTDNTVALRNSLTARTYTNFHDRGWLTRAFADNLICLLETWSKGGGQLVRQLTETTYFDELAFFSQAIREPSGIEYTNLVIFAGFVYFLRQYEGCVQKEPLNEWMRIVFNLAHNTNIERADDYGRCLAGLQKLLPHGDKIMQRLGEMEIEPLGFSPQQVREEVLKAKLILFEPSWKIRILESEKHGYFRGQIAFLLDFAGVSAQEETIRVQDWNAKLHSKLQTEFDKYLMKAQLTFNQSGLVPIKEHLWKRALLAVGDYLLRFGRNHSFLTNPPTHGDSWKRFLRDPTTERSHLKSLWDRIDANKTVGPQLNNLINSAQALEPWRAAFVKQPGLIDYCGLQEFRRESGSDEIYLLRRQQMNGTHAELFSYSLYLELDNEGTRKGLAPLKLDSYDSVTMTEFQPCIRFSFEYGKKRVRFALLSHQKLFQIQLDINKLEVLPEISDVLCKKCKFAQKNEKLVAIHSREEIHDALHHLALCLGKLPITNIK